MSVKLTDTQLVMLSAAAQRDDLCLATPDKMKGAVLSKVSEKLLKLGLVREVRAKAGMPFWRHEETGQSYTLKLTATGLKAIAVDDRPDEAIAPRGALQPRPTPDTRSASGPGAIGELARTPTPRPGSKLATVIDLLQRSEGATLSNLIEATGWLSHATRRLSPDCASAGTPSSANGPVGEIRSTVSQAPLRPAQIALSSRQKRSRAATESVSRRRTIQRRDWHGLQPSQFPAGGEAAGEDNARGFAAARGFTALDRVEPRGSQSQWAAWPMVRSFGRRASCPSPALAADEGVGLSTAGRRVRRSR
jgi:Protein of unknown function (DUF3489)